MQIPLAPSLQYAQVETPAAGNVVVLPPVENNPVSYSSINFEQLGGEHKHFNVHVLTLSVSACFGTMVNTYDSLSLQ